MSKMSHRPPLSSQFKREILATFCHGQKVLEPSLTLIMKIIVDELADDEIQLCQRLPMVCLYPEVGVWLYAGSKKHK
jgi:hypothetical protein